MKEWDSAFPEEFKEEIFLLSEFNFYFVLKDPLSIKTKERATRRVSSHAL
jgi:hypothetical protein